MLIDKECLNELNEINQLFQTSYGKYGRQILIHSKKLNNLIFTNDSMQIVKSLSSSTMTMKPFVKYLFDHLNMYSHKYGDNCKILFFYIYQMIKNLKSDDDNAIMRQTIHSLIDNQDLLNSCQTNIGMHAFDLNADLVYFDDFKFLDLLNAGNFRKTLLQIISLYACDINQIIVDLDYLLNFNRHACWDKQIEDVDDILFVNKILIQKPFVINNLKESSEINAIILFVDKHCTSSTPIVSIVDNNYLDYEGKFSQEFVDYLIRHEISLIITPSASESTEYQLRALTDHERSQINKLNCSLISYVSKDYLEYLSTKLDVNIIYLNDKTSAHRESVIYLNGYKVLNDDQIVFTLDTQRWTSKNKSVLLFLNFKIGNFVHDNMVDQFRSYVLKLLKVYRFVYGTSTKDSIGVHVVKPNSFEIVMAKIFSNLKMKSFVTAFSTLHKMFSQGHAVGSNQFEIYEFKVNCLMHSLRFVRQILNIDHNNILFSGKNFQIHRNESLMNDSDSETDS